jgi:hypothetical protein
MLKINGIKLSGELVQINLLPGDRPGAAHLLQRLADNRINLPLVTIDAAEGGVLTGAFCLAAEDFPLARAALGEALDGLQAISPVGSLTVFPHRSRLDLFRCMASGFQSRRLPIYAVASSFAALTFTTDYGRLDEAVTAVTERVTLPDNHAPFRPEFKIRQI